MNRYRRLEPGKAHWQQDDDGQWWYLVFTQGAWHRQRGELRSCSRCDEDFLAQCHRPTRYCSNACVNKRIGPENPNWGGGRFHHHSGYIRVWVPPAERSHPEQVYEAEHRLVMTKMLGRKLQRHEFIHHINGDKSDNRVENLQLVSSKSHTPGQVLRCSDCGSTHIEALPIEVAS